MVAVESMVGYSGIMRCFGDRDRAKKAVLPPGRTLVLAGTISER
jgi:hypothetical protein